MLWCIKEGSTTNHHDPHKLGYTCATMERTIGRPILGLISKSFLSSDYFLQLENMKVELPVIAYQLRCGENVLKFCTNRPSRSERRLALRRRYSSSLPLEQLDGNRSRQGHWLERSRNKVIVRERAVGENWLDCCLFFLFLVSPFFGKNRFVVALIF